MITLFRNNNPIALLLLTALALFPFWNTSLHSTVLIDSTRTILFKEIRPLIDFIDTPGFWANCIKTITLLTLALLLNKVVIDFKLMERSGYVPALCFLLFSALVPEAITAIALLINALTLTSIRLLIQVYKQEHPNNNLVAAGFCMGLVTSLISAHLMFYVWMVIAILIMRPTSLREWLIATMGFLLPFYFLASIMYLNDALDLSALIPNLSSEWVLPDLSKREWLNMAILYLLPVIGILVFNQQMSKMVILGRKSYLILFVLYLALLVVAGFNMNYLEELAGLSLIPTSFLFAPFFLAFRREYIPNLVVLALIAASLFR